jgi:hypothetical protein
MAVTIDGTNGINNAVLGSSTPAAATVTTLGASGEVTATGFTGTLDGILGSGTPAAATVTTLAAAAATVTTLTASGDLTANNFAGRNLIINGGMTIAQRGTSFAAAANGAYLLDRYKYLKSGTTGVVTITQDADMPTGHVGFSMKVDCTTADASVAAADVAGIRYFVEGFDSVVLAAGTSAAKNITISFWVKSAKTGTHSVVVQNGGNNRGYPASYTVSVADTWEYKTLTLLMDTVGTWIGATNGIGVGLFFPLIVGSNFTDPADAWVSAESYGVNSGVNILDNAANNFFLTEIQVEVGSVATEFESRPYGTELALCQRYLYKLEADTADRGMGLVGQAYSTTTAIVPILFPVMPRTTVTGITISGATDFSLTVANSGRQASTGLIFGAAFPQGAWVAPSVAANIVAGNAVTLWSAVDDASILFTGAEL